MVKWKLLLKTLPLVIAVVALTIIRDYILHIKGIVDFSDVSPLLSAVALITGFMLAGVLADYKESEKIPADIATTLETLGDTVQVVVALSKKEDIIQIESSYRALVSVIDDWFLCRIKIHKVYLALEDFRQSTVKMHSTAGAGYTTRCLGEIHNLRKSITRVDVISRTTFIPAGYAMLYLLAVTTIILLLISNYKSVFAEYTLISLLSLIYIYLVKLIHDVDSPFDYGYKRSKEGFTEVDPFPVKEYRKRYDSMRK